ncbi:heme A synthase [Synechococcus sp. PCC 6312]|uniref:COX15/CtaA family protein n=1 Tax=Synechococcus sp. (strain ATCC 27167 / PCC 6312) TaxID=195253 RepID=UPI00029EF1D6|nr:heme A synthase [Synechococcus sp. PCC 6312]AFY59763.1 uncharacterized protein required for cytochrome oxidase assembly [Synechococcus sp. PCC 6312]
MLERLTLTPSGSPKPPNLDAAKTIAQAWLYRLVVLMTVMTLFLMGVGSATRVMEAGLACPDWPLCYGELIPKQQMNLQVFLEWFHRLIATSMGVFAIGLTGLAWYWRAHVPKGWAVLASFSLLLVIVQGILGGLTVTELLRFEIVTAHLGTGLLFFCTLVVLTAWLTPYQGVGTAGWLKGWGLGAAVLVYCQSILGGLASSQWALHQCLYGDRLCGVMNSHLVGVVPASLASLVVGILAWRQAALHPLLRQLGQLIFLCLLLQIFLGSTTYNLKLAIPALTVAHQMVGAALLGTLVAFTTFVARDFTTTSLEKSAPFSPS